jgi:hypothetical protein
MALSNAERQARWQGKRTALIVEQRAEIERLRRENADLRAKLERKAAARAAKGAKPGSRGVGDRLYHVTR